MAGFTQKKLLIDLDLVTGINFQLQEYLYFDSDKFGKLRTKTDSDGISAPPNPMVQRFGPYIASGILHDGSYRIDSEGVAKLEQQVISGEWFPLLLNETECNELIEEALKSEGCSWLEREIIYNAIQLFGWHAFSEDRDSNNRPTQADIALLNKPQVIS